MQKERYEIAGVKYVVLDAEWAMRDELPVVKLDPVKFIPSGRVAWGGRKLGKSLKRSSHYFSLGEELSLCGKPLPENWAKKFANCLERGVTVHFSVSRLAHPIEVDEVMRTPQEEVCKNCLNALAKFEGNEETIQKWVDACKVVNQ